MYIYIYMCIYMYICICIYVYTYVYARVNISGKPEGHGSYRKTSVGPQYNAYTESYVHTWHGPNIHNIDCSSYQARDTVAMLRQCGPHDTDSATEALTYSDGSA